MDAQSGNSNLEPEIDRDSKGRVHLHFRTGQTVPSSGDTQHVFG